MIPRSSLQIIKSQTDQKIATLAMLAIGLLVGFLASIVPPFWLLAGWAIAIVGFFVFGSPEVGLVLTVIAGRFNRIPWFEDLGGPFYIAGFSLCLVLFVIVLRRRAWGITSPGYLVALAMFMMVLVIGVTYSISTRYALEKATEFSIYTLPLVGLALVVLQSRDNYWRLLQMMTILPLGLAVVALGTAVAFGEIGERQLSALGGGPNPFGRLMVLGAISTTGLVMSWKNGWLRLLGAAIIIFYMVCAYLTGSRQAILGVVFAVGLFVALFLVKGSWRHRAALISVIAFMWIGLIAILAMFPLETFTENIGYRRTQVLLQQGMGTSIDERLRLAAVAWDLFKQRWATGWGTGAYAVVVQGIDQRAYPHNLFLEVVAELGATGVVVLLVPLIMAGRAAFRLLRDMGSVGGRNPDSSLVMTVTVSFIYTLAVAQVSGDLYDNRWVWLWGAALVGLRKVLKSSLSSS